jgi:hypothetical protein
MKFERIIKTRPPFDKRNKDPSKDYGIGSLNLWFILKKGEKAVQVLLSTNSYLNSTIREYKTSHPDFLTGEYSKGDYEGWSCYDVGYHSNTPMYKGQTKYDCDLLKKGTCYYDGSSLTGKDDEIVKNYMLHGDEWVWGYLEKQWKIMFND